jgi:hypothetical protein
MNVVSAERFVPAARPRFDVHHLYAAEIIRVFDRPPCRHVPTASAP